MSLSPPKTHGLIRLPPELLASVCYYLPNRDVKNLRLSCVALSVTTPLRLRRVFLSANPRNIEVFRAIADHEHLRCGITEIIWDDAFLPTSVAQNEDEDEDSEDSEDDEDEEVDADGHAAIRRSVLDAGPDSGHERAPSWYRKVCRENIEELWGRKSNDASRPDHVAREAQVDAQLPYLESYEYYRSLLHQQEQVFASGADQAALEYGLGRFPALERVTITPATHGYTFNPLYETPMIRAFPYGFNYPIPRGWPAADRGENLPRPGAWAREAGVSSQQVDAERAKWRGFTIVTRAVAQHIQRQRRDNGNQPPYIPDFIVDVHQLNTGLNCHIFDSPCEEYDDLVTILQQPGFRRLDLALQVGGIGYQNWRSFRNGHFRRALSHAKDLDHFLLRTDVDWDPDGRIVAPSSGSSGSVECLIPLASTFPVDTWSRLRHFGLSRFLVQQDDVLSFLGILPRTVQSIELSFLKFVDYGGNYKTLINAMPGVLRWHERAVDEQPSVVVGVSRAANTRCGRAFWYLKEVNEFLYGNGFNPFLSYEDFTEEQRNARADEVTGVARDEFEPAYERPDTSYNELMRLGILKKDEYFVDG